VTLQLELMTPREDDIKVMLYEVYRDDAAFGRIATVHRSRNCERMEPS
jgi:quinol monooxygenase YgiN